jgi:hypothetical protein
MQHVYVAPLERAAALDAASMVIAVDVFMTVVWRRTRELGRKEVGVCRRDPRSRIFTGGSRRIAWQNSILHDT